MAARVGHREQTSGTPDARDAWLTRGVAAIGGASFLDDVAQEIPTALLPAFLTTTLAPPHLRGSAFGVLAAILSFGRLGASAVAGLLWTVVSPRAAFLYLAAWMVVSAGALVAGRASGSGRRAA